MMKIHEQYITFSNKNRIKQNSKRFYDPGPGVLSYRTSKTRSRTMSLDLKMIQNSNDMEHYKSKFRHLIEYARKEGVELRFQNLDNIIHQILILYLFLIFLLTIIIHTS